MTFKEFAAKIPCLWLSPKQVARLMQCSIEHVYDLVKLGRLCYIKDGRNIRFRPKDLNDYEKRLFARRQHVTLQEKRL
ncbi:MAG: helix-turn-helix domain-containing protein [Candidatus Aminicenantes bacterium]|nr:helix-turn-helix domain-containing protein [Candidatus Aminicenantes bacterium]